MSATNRGSVRRKGDFYETPLEVTRHFLSQHFEGEFKNILEPCAGTGKMTSALRERFPEAYITGVEKERLLLLKPLGANEGVRADFLTLDQSNFGERGDFDLIFTNPPYSLAVDVIEHALSTWEEATVVMLLRLNFLGSQDRHSWWQRRLPTEIHVLSCRPSFTGKGTDATEYAWFVWRPNSTGQKINVIWGK